MSNIPTYYWDACVFLTLITDEETRTAVEKANLYNIMNKIVKKEGNLITSAATQAEILTSTLTNEQQEKLKDVMKRRNFAEVETSGRVWELTHDIRNYYKEKKDSGENIKVVTLPDAVHLATAIIYNVDEFHTFDALLLSLNGNVADKYNLMIKKPSLAQQALGLR